MHLPQISSSTRQGKVRKKPLRGYGMKLVTPSTVKGTVAAPPSKSMMGRTVAATLLADGISVIKNPSFCDDARTALDIIGALGAVMSEGEKLAIRGTGKRLFYPKKGSLDCRESGLCMRMFTPIAALLDREVALSASGSLRRRNRPSPGPSRKPNSSCTKPKAGAGTACPRLFAAVGVRSALGLLDRNRVLRRLRRHDRVVDLPQLLE